LDRKELTDQDMEMVVKELIIDKRCTELSLNSNNITQRGASILADGLRKNNTLISLKLNGNQMSDKGVFAIAKALETANKTLETLDLGSNDITDQGAIYLAEMLKTNTALTNLDLSINRIGERGVRHLVGALDGDNKGLKRLSLRTNKSITDSSVDWLATMIRCNTFLDILDVGNCSLSTSSKEQLQKTVPSKRAFSLVV
jgi:Ran GTPase-activating protein (RanGAP) involved in mRNA processing and transport